LAVVSGINTREISITLEGLDQLEEQFALIGKPPKRILTKAAKAGIAPTLAEARQTAPKGKTGMLKRGVHSIQETPNRRNKGVYRINWWSKYSDFYRKKIKNAGVYGGKKNPAYYPQSVEWGYPTKHGKKAGRYFVRAAMEAHQAQSLQTVIDVLLEEIENLL